MSQSIILKVTELQVQKPYSAAKATFEPVGDVLFQTEVEHTETLEDGRTVLTKEGMRELIQNVSYVLYFEDGEDI